VEHGVRVFEKRVLRRIFATKRDDVTGGCRGLHSKELGNMSSSPSVISITKLMGVRREGHVACKRKSKKAYTRRILVTKPDH
jgi:hypothetical protein